MNHPLRRAVPKKVWLPLADAIAHEHGITVNQLRFEDMSQRFFIPRAKFWKALRALPKGYSLGAIGDVTGHHHTSVLSGLRSASSDKDYAHVVSRRRRSKYPKRRIDLVGKQFGALLVTSRAKAPNPAAKHKVRWWTCECECGISVIAPTHALQSGRRKKCGGSHYMPPVNLVLHRTGTYSHHGGAA